MNDTPEGSSIAAHSAQQEDEKKPTGFFKRLFASNDDANEALPPYSDKITPASGLKILTDLRVDDVAVPRSDIIAVTNDLKLDELLKVFKDSGYSRLPVYNDTLDKPEGLLHLKDLALKHGFNGKATRFSMKRMLRPLLYVPPSMAIGVLLQKNASRAYSYGIGNR